MDSDTFMLAAARYGSGTVWGPYRRSEKPLGGVGGMNRAPLALVLLLGTLASSLVSSGTTIQPSKEPHSRQGYNSNVVPASYSARYQTWSTTSPWRPWDPIARSSTRIPLGPAGTNELSKSA